MEKINKKITLVDFKNYNPNTTPVSLDNNDTWGGFPLDIYIDEQHILYNSSLPFVSEVVDNKNVKRLRYYNIKKLYYFLEKYYNSMIYYRLIENSTIKKWSLYKNYNNEPLRGIYTGLPSVDEFVCDDKVATNQYQDEFVNIFKDQETVDRFKELCDEYFSGSTLINYGIPYINIPLQISSDIFNLGEFVNDLQKWESMRDYFIGDVVFYENNYYVCISDHVGEHTFKERLWDKIDVSTQQSEPTEKVKVPSKLSTFISQRLTYDDDGNELPFLYDDDKHVYLMYQNSYRNYEVRSDAVVVDTLLSVECGELSGDTIVWSEINSDPNNFLYKYDKDDFANVSYIKFKYLINVCVDENDKLINGTGIEYEEIRPCENKSMTFTYNRNIDTVYYLEISDMNDYDYPIPMAKIFKMSLNDWRDKLDKYTHLFNDDRLNGASYIDFETPLVGVDRGDYIAMERHYIMGEVNSFDDLQKYRNNYFKL